MIKIGEKIPSVNLKILGEAGMEDLTSESLFGGRKILLFAVPGAYTPTCSAKHLPGYLDHLEAIKSRGIDEVFCLAVNDPFVMQAWGRANNAEGKIRLLPDGNGTFSRAMGLTFDGSGFGLGERAQRFAMLVEDGVVKNLQVEAPGAFEVSSAEAMLKQI